MAEIDIRFSLPICKIDKEKKLISGYASTPTKDLDGEVITLDAIKSALPGFMSWGGPIREMHQPRAVGKTQEAHVDEKGLYITAKISDDRCWKLIEEGVLQAFSIGGRKLSKTGDTITEVELIETSVVDRPANPDCRFDIAKSAKNLGEASGYLMKVKIPRDPSSKALAKMAQAVELMTKAGPPAAHDGFSLPGIVKGTLCKAHNLGDCADCKCAAHGTTDCEKCAGIGKRDFNSKERDSGASSGAAESDGSFPIENASDLKNAIQAYGRSKDKAKTKSHIIARAKALGHSDLIPEGWSKLSKKAQRRLAKRTAHLTGLSKKFDLDLSPASAVPSFLTLSAEGVVGGSDFEGTNAGSSLGAMTKRGEDGNQGRGFLDLEKTTHITFSEEIVMSEDVVRAITEVLNKARKDGPSRSDRMNMARDNMKKAAGARKEASAAIKECHAMLKASYLAKEALVKAGKKPDADGDFDAADAMGKLQKAFSALATMKTFQKGAVEQIKKAASMRADGPTTGNAEFTVPAGVRALSQSELTEGTPPLYPDDGSVYPGKSAKKLAKLAKDGQVSAELAELLVENARLEGENEALGRLPAGGGSGRRPYAFDVTKVGLAGNDPKDRDANAALMKGVNPIDLASSDETTHTRATAKMLGNMITSGHFGKSVFEDGFAGSAGSRA